MEQITEALSTMATGFTQSHVDHPQFWTVIWILMGVCAIIYFWGLLSD